MFFLSGCSFNQSEEVQAQALQSNILPSTPQSVPTMIQSTVTPAPEKIAVWIDPALPQAWNPTAAWNESRIRLVDVPDLAEWKITINPDSENQISWVYALAVPFPVITDEVSVEEILAAWHGEKHNTFQNQPIFLSPETMTIFSRLWGAPVKGAVEVMDENLLLETVWKKGNVWALIPFEQLEPRWKVLRVDGISPLDEEFVPSDYPLTVGMGLEAVSGDVKKLEVDMVLPPGNRQEELMTSLIMTGTTALVRNTALKMEEKGVLYPGEKLRDFLRSADITHISNEISFSDTCPPGIPLRNSMRFCSRPEYYELLLDVGTDIIELTGNHLLDWGEDAFLNTLDLYQQDHIAVFGGGRTLTEAVQPLLIEDHGNRLAFLGCNPAGPDEDWADEQQGGSAPCDLEGLEVEVARLKADSWNVIFTFQAVEVDDFKPTSAQHLDFPRMAEAGAVIVSGSQAHYPQGAAFLNDTFIHYGLGNLFFDQMTKYNRRAFIDRHIFYNGRYISTEMRTILIEDYAQPRWMTEKERNSLLEEIFQSVPWPGFGTELQTTLEEK